MTIDESQGLKLRFLNDKIKNYKNDRPEVTAKLFVDNCAECFSKAIYAGKIMDVQTK